MALWQLARAGVKAIGFEQWSPGHDQSAAGGESRIFRTAYQEGAEYVPLLLRAYDLWSELEAESGFDLFTQTGCLMIGPLEHESLRRVLHSAETYGVPHKVLDDGQLARRYPQLRFLPGDSAVLDERAGVVRPEFAVVAAARAAQALGAVVVSGVRVHAVEPVGSGSGSGVVVRTEGRDYEVGQVILAPGPWLGPWLGKLAPALAPHVQPKKEVLSWYLAHQPADYVPSRFPVFVRYGRDPHVFGMPTLDGGSVKVGLWPQEGAFDDPDALDRNVPPSALSQTNAAVARYLPGLTPTPIRVSAYMDAYTSDDHGLVGRLPGFDNVWVLGGFSGHGFKLAPMIGELAAQLLRDGRTELSIDHLAPGRFAAS
jgi:sarcosine oxidase